MPPSRRKFALLLGLALLVICACNMPGLVRSTEEPASPLYTAAAQTIAAQYTQVSKPPATQAFPLPTGAVPTFAPPTPIQPQPTVAVPTATPSVTPPPPTATLPPTSTPLPCDRIKFVKDVTIPDNTVFSPGDVFVKTWRLRNAGSCTWTRDYDLVFAGGDAMNASGSSALSHNVPPGEEIDVSMTFTAPGNAGTYRGNWKLRNGAGQVFGLGDDGAKPFWVQIKVAVQSGITYDFLVKARDAEWISSVGSGPGTALTFGGADDDPNGVAKIKDAVVMETGATSGKILLTVPKHENNGVISGLFPAYTVQRGDFLRAKLGFMLTGSGCHSGKVKFQIMYKDGGAPKLLQEWVKSCTGSFIDVNIDLSGLSGKSVQFGFVVLAEGPATDDWAIWNSPRVEH
jgi:hypothetical protein